MRLEMVTIMSSTECFYDVYNSAMLLQPATDRTWFHYGFLNLSKMHSLGNFFVEYYTGYKTDYTAHSIMFIVAT